MFVCFRFSLWTVSGSGNEDDGGSLHFGGNGGSKIGVVLLFDEDIM